MEPAVGSGDRIPICNMPSKSDAASARRHRAEMAKGKGEETRGILSYPSAVLLKELFHQWGLLLHRYDCVCSKEPPSIKIEGEVHSLSLHPRSSLLKRKKMEFQMKFLRSRSQLLPT